MLIIPKLILFNIFTLQKQTVVNAAGEALNRLVAVGPKPTVTCKGLFGTLTKLPPLPLMTLNLTIKKIQ